MIITKCVADRIYDGMMAEAEFEDCMFGLGGSSLDYTHTTYDSYDSSVEFKDAKNNARLNKAQQKYLYDSGFLRCWICHKDGSETYYQMDAGTMTEHRKEAK